MWIYVFLGNVLRGIGETPVQPLGISYIDDYAQSENAALYIGNVPYSRPILAALQLELRQFIRIFFIVAQPFNRFLFLYV